jgi:acetylglutamate kinase
MQEAIDKATALIEAMEYIQAFSEKIVVIKLGGAAQEEAAAREAFIDDVVLMSAVGIRPVIVHGGGPAISRAMKEKGLVPRFIQGRRYTDEQTLAVAEDVLVNRINARIVADIGAHNGGAMGLHSLASCVLFAERMTTDEAGEPLDLGLVGEVTKVNGRLLEALCRSGMIPVIAPIARDAAGGKLNVNADTAAGEVAAAVGAEKLVMLTDTHGVWTDPANPKSLASTLTESQIQKMIAEGAIDGGMLPKVAACLRAIGAGVPKAHIIDGRILHSVLLEIYTEKGIGTQILLDSPEAGSD